MPYVPTPIFSLRRRIQSLEKDLRDLRQVVLSPNTRPGMVNASGNIFLAKTKKAGGTYPTAPNTVFGIVFMTAAFTRSEGNHTPTYTEHSGSVQDYALSTIGYIDEGEVVAVERLRNGQYIIIPMGGQFKPWCRFTLDADLTTGSEWKLATITDQYGQGATHTVTSIVVHNLLTHSAGVYEYYADEDDAGYAFFDKYEVDTGGDYGESGATVAHWRINPVECP